ncbi:hypothetical protein [Halomonas sp. AOP42-D1-22]
MRHLGTRLYCRDDYEFNRDGHPNLLFDPLSERHLLVGSFSKMMFPGSRL